LITHKKRNIRAKSRYNNKLVRINQDRGPFLITLKNSICDSLNHWKIGQELQKVFSRMAKSGLIKNNREIVIRTELSLSSNAINSSSEECTLFFRSLTTLEISVFDGKNTMHQPMQTYPELLYLEYCTEALKVNYAMIQLFQKRLENAYG
jgi:hypothetical protein